MFVEPLSAAGFRKGTVSTFSLVLFVLFMQSYVIERILFSPDVNLTYLFGLLAAGTIGLVVLNRGYVQKVKVMAVDLAVMLFIGVLFAAAFVNGTDQKYAITTLFASIFPYFVARLYVLPASYIAHCVGKTLLWVAVAISCLLLIEHLTSIERLGRLEFRGVHPIAMGEVIGFGTVVALVWAISADRKLKWAYVVLASICLTTQFVKIGARGSVFAFFLAVLPMVVLRVRSRKAGMVVMVIAVALGIALVYSGIGTAERFLPTHIAQDPSLVGNEVFRGRFDYWHKSVSIFLSAPLLGQGPGSVYAHNIFLEISASMGLLGLVSFLLVIAAVPWRRVWKIAQTDDSVMLVCVLLAFVFIYRNASFDLTMHKSLFGFLGLLIGMHRRAHLAPRVKGASAHCQYQVDTDQSGKRPRYIRKR